MPLLAAALLGTALQCTPAPTAPDSTMEAIWARGRPVREFAMSARALREQWRRGVENAAIPATLVSRARRSTTKWRVLAVAADGCHDSVNALPILGALDDSLGTLEVRVVTPDIGGAIQHENRSYNGRRVTPTIVLLDSTGAQVGCIVERPRPLREQVRTAFGDFVGGDSTVFSSRVTVEQFWAADRGVAMATETIEMLEGAERGFPMCSRGQPAPGGRDPVPQLPRRRPIP